MSAFDADAADIWDEIESVFGDQATWRTVDADIALVVVADSDHRDVELRGGEAIVSFSIQRADLPEFSPHDILVVQTGRYAGQYDAPKTIEDDGYTVIVEMRRV